MPRKWVTAIETRVVSVAEGVLVVLGGKRRVSGWRCSSTGCACGQELPGGTGHCHWVVTSATALRRRRGGCGSAELLCFRVSLSWGQREAQSCHHKPVPGVSGAKGCGEPVCANLCQTHQARLVCVLLTWAEQRAGPVPVLRGTGRVVTSAPRAHRVVRSKGSTSLFMGRAGPSLWKKLPQKEPITASLPQLRPGCTYRPGKWLLQHCSADALDRCKIELSSGFLQEQ